MIETASLVTIRPAHPTDATAIEELHRESVRRLAVSYYSPAQLESFLATRMLDRRLIEAGTYYVAQVLGVLVGSGGWMPVEQSSEGARGARIRSVFVHPDWARRGIGRRLVLHAEAEAARSGFTLFELEASLPGVPLYRRLGDREVARTGLALPDGSTLPVIRMAKARDAAAAVSQ
jgi:GNAT superfamily N-acetyltransferase